MERGVTVCTAGGQPRRATQSEERYGVRHPDHHAGGEKRLAAKRRSDGGDGGGCTGGGGFVQRRTVQRRRAGASPSGGLRRRRRRRRRRTRTSTGARVGVSVSVSAGVNESSPDGILPELSQLSQHKQAQHSHASRHPWRLRNPGRLRLWRRKGWRLPLVRLAASTWAVTGSGLGLSPTKLASWSKMQRCKCVAGCVEVRFGWAR
jgi:hypothetical protein